MWNVLGFFLQYIVGEVKAKDSLVGGLLRPMEAQVIQGKRLMGTKVSRAQFAGTSKILHFGYHHTE